MAATKESSPGATPEDTLGREEYSDFALVLKNGQELLCHKVKLAEVSPVFRAMLRQNCAETQSNKMKVTQFGPETVESFLDYVYTDIELVPDQALYQKNFDEERLTPELLRMCHMYGVKNLQNRCVEHLKESIGDINAVDIWSAAEIIGNDSLKTKALNHLVKKKDKLLEIPGLKDSFQSPKLVESLVKYMSDQIVSPSCNDVITVKLQCWGTQYGERFIQVQDTIQVKLCDTVEAMRLQIDNTLATFDEDGTFSGYFCKPEPLRAISPSFRYFLDLHEEDKTLASYNIKNNYIVQCEVCSMSGTFYDA